MSASQDCKTVHEKKEGRITQTRMEHFKRSPWYLTLCFPSNDNVMQVVEMLRYLKKAACFLQIVSNYYYPLVDDILRPPQNVMASIFQTSQIFQWMWWRWNLLNVACKLRHHHNKSASSLWNINCGKYCLLGLQSQRQDSMKARQNDLISLWKVLRDTMWISKGPHGSARTAVK